MKRMKPNKRILGSLLAGLVVGVLAMIATVRLASAAPLPQGEQPHPTANAQNCRDCHLDIANSWETSPHAHAFDDANFQQLWHGAGSKGDCLLCHTTNYQATSGSYDAPGVSCEACHGKVDANHPPSSVAIRADTEYCGSCHTTTLGEWRLTGHAAADVGCTDCHDPHSQKALFENADDMCVNCHKDSMGPYLENIHAKKGIGCVDCHALVIPPETQPADGIVPTGHTFTITPATCVACHTDALHSGFSLPGYEGGAKAANGNTPTTPQPVSVESKTVHTPEEQIQLLQNQLQVVTANAASRSMTILFQGGVVGLVLGGSTAWIVANNVRRHRKEEEQDEEQE